MMIMHTKARLVHCALVAAALVAAGIRRVVCASLDPNPKVSGRGLAVLRRAGIRAEVVKSDSSESLNRGFFSRMRRGRPWVILKTALSPSPSTPEELAALTASDHARFGKLIRAINLKDE